MMLKAVPDVNIHVSALIKPDGHSAQILDRIGEFVSYTSESMLKDTERALHYDRILRKYQLTEEAVAQYLQRLRRSHAVVTGAYEVHGVAPDPDDDKIIACALDAGADYIITGDPHLLNLKQYRGIQIITPRAFLEILDREKAG